MATIQLYVGECDVLQGMLLEANPRALNTIRELRVIIRICDVLKKAQENDTGGLIAVEIDSDDLPFLVKRFDEFAQWDPKASAAIFALEKRLKRLE